MIMGMHHINSWTKYRDLAKKYTPDIMFYSLEPHPLRQPPWGLKLIFYHGHDSYVFRDYADGAALYKTKIPIKDNDPREAPILVEDIEQFIDDQIGRIQVSSIGAFLSL
jgi:hypothetical protein